MRILLSYVVMGHGGDAVQWTSLAEGFRLTGHSVRLVGAHTVRPYPIEDTTARLRAMVRRLPWWIRDAIELSMVPIGVIRALWAARRLRADLIVHRAMPYEMMAPILATVLRAPVVVYLDAHLPAEREFRSQSYWRWLHEATMRWAGRTAALLVAPSRAIHGYYRGVGIPAGKMCVRRNAVFARHLAMGADAVRSSPPMGRDGDCVLGFVGSFSDWHRVDVLLEALALLATRDGGIRYRLVVIGTGRQDAPLKALAGRLAIGHLVEWRGPLSHDRAVEAMREFDVAVLPSTLPTGAPMKLFEYAAMGRPIVAPALPNISALFVSDIEAVLVEPGSPSALAAAVAGLAADPARAQRIGRAGQARVRGFTWEEMAASLIGIVVKQTRDAGSHEAYRAAGY